MSQGKVVPKESLKPGTPVQIVVTDGDVERYATAMAEQWGTHARVLSAASFHVSLLRDTVAEEMAMALEHAGMEPAQMEHRVAQMLADLGISELAARHPAELSGGQTKRLAIGSVLIGQPEVIIISEPWAGLDPESRERIRDALTKHATQHSSRVALLVSRQLDFPGIETISADSPGHPELPVAIEYRDSRAETGAADVDFGDVVAYRGLAKRIWWQFWKPRVEVTDPFTVGPVHVRCTPGTVTWLRGPNGSGKTTLLRALAGLDGNPSRGIGLALQQPVDQVINPTVGELLNDDELISMCGVERDEHPLDLSPSQQHVVQVASVLHREHVVVALDEPDTGLTVDGREKIHAMIAQALMRGKALIITCHESEFMAEVEQYAQVRQLHLSQQP